MLEYGAYLVFIGVAIASVYFLLVRMGWRQDAPVSRAVAQELLQQYDPDAEFVAMLAVGNATLMQVDGGRLAVARGVGAKPTVHLFAGADIVSVSRTANGVSIKTRDFGNPSMTFATTDPDEVIGFIEAARQ